MKTKLKLTYGISETPYNKVILAFTDNGITDLFFIITSQDEAIKKLQKKWAKAHVERDDSKIEKLIHQIFYQKFNTAPLKLHLVGTNFQISVWKALLAISNGSTCSYSCIAKIINNPKATRAVGSAIRRNPIQYLIPCHRVIKKDGNIGEYAGGIEIKEKLLASESLHKRREDLIQIQLSN